MLHTKLIMNKVRISYAQLINNKFIHLKKIKEYITENRVDFEESFSNKNEIWKSLEQHIAPEKNMKKLFVIKYWRWSAVAACIVGVFVFFMFQNLSKKNNPTVFCSVNGVSKTFCQQINAYESDIQNTIIELHKNNLTIPDEVANEVKVDNPMKQILLNELIKNPNNQKIQEAILRYYKAKLELVQRIEEVLKNQEKNIQNETTNNTII